MKYNFKVTIHTDGDFHFPFVPCGMKDDGYEFYMLDKDYKDRSEAIKDILSICAFLKEQMYTNRNYIREYWESTVDDFVKRLHASKATEYEYVASYMNGNYDGTELIFQAIPHVFKCNFSVTDEEWALLMNNGNDVTMGMVKDAVLALFKEVT